MDRSWTVSRAGAWLLAAWAGLALAGCGGSGGRPPAPAPRPTSGKPQAKPGTGRIVLVTNGNSDWWSAVEKGMKDGAAKFSADVEMKRNDEGAGTEGQIRLLEEALGASDVKGVAVSAVEADAPGIADAMRKLKDAGKLVITIDSDVAAERRRHPPATTSGPTTPRRARSPARPPRPSGPQGGTGRRLRRDRLGRQRPGPARRLLRRGRAPSSSSRPIEIFEDQTDMNRAQSLPEIAITKHPDVGVMLGLYSYNAPRIAAEVAKRPRLPQEDDRRHLRPRRAGRRAPREGRHRRLGLPEPLRDRLPGRPAALGPDEGRQGDRRGHVPQGQRPASTPASA